MPWVDKCKCGTCGHEWYEPFVYNGDDWTWIYRDGSICARCGDQDYLEHRDSKKKYVKIKE